MVGEMSIASIVPVVRPTTVQALLRLSLTIQLPLVAGPNTIIFNVEGVDIDNEYDPATGIYTASADGTRTLTGMLASDDGAIAETYIYVDGVPFRVITLATTNAEVSISASLDLTVGQTIQVVCNRSASGVNVTGDPLRTWLTIAK